MATRKTTSPFSELEAHAASLAPKRTQCHVGALIAGLAESDATYVRSALANVALTSVALSKALGDILGRDAVPNPPSFQRHRNGSCNCPKEA